MSRKKLVMLVVMDGYGLAAAYPGNAVAAAKNRTLITFFKIIPIPY